MTLYRLLDEIPEELSPRALSHLAFVKDKKLRESIARDIDALDRLVLAGEWKAATVIGGSVVEALLLAALIQRPNKTRALSEIARRQATGSWRLTKKVEELTLSPLVELARSLQVIGETVANACNAAGGLRNLVPPR